MTSNENRGEDTAECRHCGRTIWWMGTYRGWVHADSWVAVCDTSTHQPVAEPPAASPPSPDRCPFCDGPLATDWIYGSIDGTPSTEFAIPGTRYCANDCGYGAVVVAHRPDRPNENDAEESER